MRSVLAPADPIEAEADLASIGGYAAAFYKLGAAPQKVHALSGELYYSDSGWLLLRVPAAFVRGAFDALDVLGAELPPGKNGKPFNPHISVMHRKEIEALGGPGRISERGHHFSYTLGPVKEVEPQGWDEMSAAYLIETPSPDLEDLRKSYGLSPRLKDHQFHVTIGVKRKGVLKDNDVVKAPVEPAPRKSLSSLFSRLPKKQFKAAIWAKLGAAPLSIMPFPVGSTAVPAPPGPSVLAPAVTPVPQPTANIGGTKVAADRPVRADAKDPVDRENCPHCDTPMERGDDGYCNRCGKPWPAKTAAVAATPAINRAAVAKALISINRKPTPAQVLAGNYRMGHLRFKGLDITIENPVGSVRRGVSKSGRPWETTLRDAYGYFRRTEGKDGDHIDVFIRHDDGDHGLDSELVFVVNQYLDGKFDEWKCVLACASKSQARETYLRNYSSGWDGLHSIATLTIPQFKWYLANGDTKKPLLDADVPVKAGATRSKICQGVPNLETDEVSMPEQERQGIPALRRAGDYGLRKLASFQWVLGGYGTVPAELHFREEEKRSRLLSG